jgi:hypothetical protein
MPAFCDNRCRLGDKSSRQAEQRVAKDIVEFGHEHGLESPKDMTYGVGYGTEVVRRLYW